MKKLNLIIWIYLLMGCSGLPEILEQEIDYIDYSCCSQEELSQKDRTLLENVVFKEGQLSCSLDLKSALGQGIPEKKYNYFIEYLQNENQKFEEYLEAGGIVFYNGIPFTRNEELYQYVENKEESFSRADYNQAALVWSKGFVGRYDGIIPEERADFKGPSKIGISKSNGGGAFELKEEFKKLTAYIGGTESSAVFKWGFGNDVLWNWKIKYFGSAYDRIYLYVTGHWEDPMPEFPPYDIVHQKFWWNNMPSYVHLTHNRLDNYINIFIETAGNFSAQVYKKVNKDYNRYSFIEQFSGNLNVRVSTPPECTFWIVIYCKKIVDQKIHWTYLGDMEFRYPLHWS
jgi:lipoprotein